MLSNVHSISIFGCVNNGIMEDLNVILDDPNEKYLFDQVQDGNMYCSLWPNHQIGIQKRLMLKISAISNDLNNILDELDTILDDPYDRYLSGAQTLTATSSTIVYFYVNSQWQVNNHQNVLNCCKGKNGSYPGSCSRQVPNLFNLSKIESLITNGMPNYTYSPNMGLLAQSKSIQGCFGGFWKIWKCPKINDPILCLFWRYIHGNCLISLFWSCLRAGSWKSPKQYGGGVVACLAIWPLLGSLGGFGGSWPPLWG